MSKINCCTNVSKGAIFLCYGLIWRFEQILCQFFVSHCFMIFCTCITFPWKVMISFTSPVISHPVQIIYDTCVSIGFKYYAFLRNIGKINFFQREGKIDHRLFSSNGNCIFLNGFYSLTQNDSVQSRRTDEYFFFIFITEDTIYCCKNCIVLIYCNLRKFRTVCKSIRRQIHQFCRKFHSCQIHTRKCFTSYSCQTTGKNQFCDLLTAFKC